MKTEDRVQMRVERERAWVQVRVGKSIWNLGGGDSVRMTEAMVAALRGAIAEAEAEARADERDKAAQGDPRTWSGMLCEKCNGFDATERTLKGGRAVRLCTRCTTRWGEFALAQTEFRDYEEAFSLLRAWEKAGGPTPVAEPIGNVLRATQALFAISGEWLAEKGSNKETSDDTG